MLTRIRMATLPPASETIHWEKIVEKFSTVSTHARASPAPMMNIMTAVISPVFRNMPGDHLPL